MSRVTCHVKHVMRCASHVTRHTLHVTRHLQGIQVPVISAHNRVVAAGASDVEVNTRVDLKTKGV